MARVAPFHSATEARKPPAQRVCHNDDACSLGRTIPRWERREGTGGHRLCKECDRLGRSGPDRVLGVAVTGLRGAAFGRLWVRMVSPAQWNVVTTACRTSMVDT